MVILRWLFVESFVAKIINSWWLQLLLPVVAGAYFVIFRTWKDEWPFFIANKSFSEDLFKVLFFITLISQIYRVIGDRLSNAIRESYLQFLEGFMILTANVVDYKLKRFRKAAPKLKLQSNTFKAITKPEEQIEHIVSQSIQWLMNSFSLGNEQISVTIIHINGKTDASYYFYKSHQIWEHTKAKDIVSTRSAASYCLEKGESIFFPDKFLSAQKGDYYLSDRDHRTRSGSAYCYPVVVKLPNHEDKFVISVITYGKLLCAPEDGESSKIAQTILSEICRRIELELTLYSIKLWQQ